MMLLRCWFVKLNRLRCVKVLSSGTLGKSKADTDPQLTEIQFLIHTLDVTPLRSLE